jgi:hypothetical protein
VVAWAVTRARLEGQVLNIKASKSSGSARNRVEPKGIDGFMSKPLSRGEHSG